MHRLLQFISYVCVVIAHLIAATTRLTWAEYTTVYLEDACHCPSTRPHLPCQPLTVEPDPDRPAGFVFLSRRHHPSPFGWRGDQLRHCLLTVRSPPRMHVHVQLEEVDIPMVAGTCRGAILHLYDGPTTDDLKQQLVGVCGSALPLQRGFSSTGSELTLSYSQGPEVQDAKKSFNVTFTYFTKRKSGCRETEFRCTGGHFGCISGQLTCDGVDNCGDASDESSDYNACGKYSPSSNPAVGGSVGVLVVLSVFALLIGLALYGANKRTQATAGASCLQLPVTDDATNHISPEMSTAQPLPLDGSSGGIGGGIGGGRDDEPMPRLPEIGSPLGVVSDEATVTTYRIIHVTPNPERRQLQLTVVPCSHLLSPAAGGELMGRALRASPPPPYDSLFPSTHQPNAGEGEWTHQLG